MHTLKSRKHFVTLDEANLPHYVTFIPSNTSGLIKEECVFNKDPKYSEKNHIDFANQYLLSLPHKEYFISRVQCSIEHFYKVKLNNRDLEIVAYIPTEIVSNLYGKLTFKYLSDSGEIECTDATVYDIGKKKEVQEVEDYATKEVINNFLLQVMSDVTDFLYRLSLKDIRVASKEIGHLIKVNSKKSKHIKTNLTLVVLNKDLLNNNGTSGIPTDVTWEHSWIRRGHWRTIKETALGKDMFGDRNQIGRTWVIESHINSDLDLKNNIRLLKSA